MANELMKMPTLGNQIANYVTADAVKESIIKVASEKNQEVFTTSIVSAVQANPKLKECTCASIVSVGLMGMSLHLPPSPQLGYFHFVPYKTKKNINGKWTEIMEAQFQLGYKGYLQLAIRSGQYKNIVCNEIKEGEIEYNPITEEITLHPIMNPSEREKAAVIGYYAAFELMAGFRKQMFMSVEGMKAHARQYSSAYRYDLNTGKKLCPWSTNFDAMAKKTMIRLLLSKWGIMSVEMQQAYVNDMSVIDEDGTARYVDNQPETIEERVHQDIEANANSQAFEDAEVIDAEVVEAPTEEHAPQPQPEKPRRGRPPKAQAPTPAPEKPAMPEPEPPVTDGEPEVSFAPEWE